MIRESNYGVQWVGERKGGDGVSRSVVSRRRDLAGGGVFASALAPLGTQQVILPGASVRDHMMAEGSGPKDEPDGPGTSFRIVVLDLRRRGGRSGCGTGSEPALEREDARAYLVDLRLKGKCFSVSHGGWWSSSVVVFVHGRRRLDVF